MLEGQAADPVGGGSADEPEVDRDVAIHLDALRTERVEVLGVLAEEDQSMPCSERARA